MKSETRWKFNGILRTMVVALILTMVLPFWTRETAAIPLPVILWAISWFS